MQDSASSIPAHIFEGSGRQSKLIVQKYCFEYVNSRAMENFLLSYLIEHELIKIYQENRGGCQQLYGGCLADSSVKASLCADYFKVATNILEFTKIVDSILRINKILPVPYKLDLPPRFNDRREPDSLEDRAKAGRVFEIISENRLPDEFRTLFDTYRV